MVKQFNVPFINATRVISAWADDRLVGAVRILSDGMVRPAIYDLLVAPAYQNMGVGSNC